ncbi:MAG: alpha/beta hydrolase [Oscillospiraceae bacterium]|nr:alpha/beta hydrolase [Oscillospiraceae bacterium]
MPSKEFENRRGSIWERTSFFDRPFPEVREEMDKVVLSELKVPSGARIEEGECGGIHGYWVKTDAPADKFIYYVHGGGFTLGSSVIALPFLCQMASKYNINSFSIDYRLAPEHCFPAGIEDSCAGYRGLLELGYKAENIVISGESAGANFALVLPLRFRKMDLPFPGALVAMSPLVDMRPTSQPKNEVIHDLPEADGTLSMYAPGEKTDNPEISPILGNLEGFPPTFLIAGGAEELCPHSTKMAAKLAESGCEVKLLVGKDMIHTYPLDCLDHPEAMNAFEEIALFIQQL